MAQTPAQRSSKATPTTDDRPVLLQFNMAHTKDTSGARRWDTPQNEADRLKGNVNLYLRKEVSKELPEHFEVTIRALP